MYEVTFMEYENNWDTGYSEQVFTTEQFNNLDDAVNYFEDKKKYIDVEHVRLSRIIEEYSRREKPNETKW